MNRKKIFKAFAFAIYLPIATLGLFLVIEGVFRISGFKPLIPEPFKMSISTFDELLGFKAKPNSTWSFITTPEGGPAVINIGTVDEFGYRPIVTNRNCNTCPTIIVLGDSLTFGAEVADDSTWPELLAKALEMHDKQYKVRNISYRGFSTVQLYLALKEVMKTIRKIEAVLYMFSPNDHVESLERIYGLPAPILSKNPNDEFYIVKPEFARRVVKEKKYTRYLNRIKYSSAIIPALGKILDIGTLNKNLLPPRIDTSDNGYRQFWLPDVLSRVMYNLETLRKDDEESVQMQEGLEYLLKEMAIVAKNKDIKFYVAAVPFGAFTEGETGYEFAELLDINKGELRKVLDAWKNYYRKIENIAIHANAIFLEVDPNLFAGMSYRQYAAKPDDWHYSLIANRLLANDIADKLLREGLEGN